MPYKKEIWVPETGYLIYLQLAGKGTPLELTREKSYSLARSESEKFGKVLNLLVEDVTGQEVVSRLPEHLDESFQERAERTGEITQLPTTPANSRIQYASSGNRAAP